MPLEGLTIALGKERELDFLRGIDQKAHSALGSKSVDVAQWKLQWICVSCFRLIFGPSSLTQGLIFTACFSDFWAIRLCRPSTARGTQSPACGKT